MIDIVLPYVNNNESSWITQYNQFSELSGDKSVNRFRDPDTLKYWFRSIEKYCNFTYRIVLVVSNHSQVPRWLNTDRLLVITHEHFIPHNELPTFNSSVITCYLPFINELNNKYILFNDDMFIMHPINESTFYTNDTPNIHFSQTRFEPHRGMWFDKINLCQDIIGNWLHKPTHVIPEHAPMPHIKSLDLYLWKSLHTTFQQALTHSKFRRYGNISDWIFIIAYYGLQFANNLPNSICTYYNTEKISIPQTTIVACYNDTELITDFNSYKTSLTNLLSTVFSEPSTYEV